MKKSIILLFVLIQLCLIGGCTFNKGKEDIVDRDMLLENYVLTNMTEDSMALSSISLLQNSIEEISNQKLDIIAFENINNENAIFVGTAILAEEMNVDISTIGIMGYYIKKIETNIYIYANSEKGFNRAFQYFSSCISEDGSCLEIKQDLIVDMGKESVENILVGDRQISEYVIVIPEQAEEEIVDAAKNIQFYITKESGILIPIYETNENIALSIEIKPMNIEQEDSKFEYKNKIAYGKITITGKDAKACLTATYDFINTYLGWSFSENDQAKLSVRTKILTIPDTVILSEDTPWMEEREAIICLWKINNSRGVYINQNTSLLNDIMSFSEEQLYEYVRMLKYCGYTGIQITEMCSAWEGSGDYEYVHERIRILADAAHSMGMNVTLWVWGAEFDGYGWTDSSVSYLSEGYSYLQENPKALEFFDRYYSIYAELADCVDRVIAHYYDPGNLYASEDVAFYANMLKGKMQAVNPEIDFGVNCWVDVFDKAKFVENLGNDITLYETSSWDDPGARVNFRNQCDTLGCRLGTWSWGICEMEIDQLAQMNVNANIIQETYLKAVAVDESTTKPSYWSEMDSYHVLNVFSLYCSGHLLANPTADTELLLREVAFDTVGEAYQDDFYEILDLIQDARSGDTKETFIWGNDTYLLKSKDYPAQEILDRCNTYIPILDKMIDEELEANTIPLPIDLVDLLRLIRPHVEQIKLFAEFRLGMDEIEVAFEEGESAENLSQMLEELYKPIPEFNCVIGLWGQIEARMQYIIIEEFCAKAKIEVPQDETFTTFRKMRIYQQLCSLQKGEQEPVLASKTFFQWGVAFGEETTIELVNELVAEGLLIETEEETVYLKDWKNYVFDFK